MTDYIDAAVAAKMLRAALKAKFPGVKFSVKTSKYAGGASLRVEYTDGPKPADVEAIAKPFSGSGFDGMIDMAYSKTAIQLADGTITFGSSEGTENAAGIVPAKKAELPEGAKFVRFMSDYVFVEREVSPALLTKAFEAVADRYGFDKSTVVIGASEWSGKGVFVEGGDLPIAGAVGWDSHWNVRDTTRRETATMEG